MNQNKVKYSQSNWELVSVNPNFKNWNWRDLFCFWAVNIQSIVGFSLITSFYTVYSINAFVILFGTIFGCLLVYLFSNLIGKPSQKYGLPFSVILRSSFGYNAAKYLGLLRSLVGIFLFGIQTYFLSQIFTYLIRVALFTFNSLTLENEIFLTHYLGLNVIDLISLFIAIFLQVYLFSQGMNFNKKIINISAVTVYLGIIIFSFVIFFTNIKLTSQAFLDIFNLNNFLNLNNLIALFTIAGIMFAYFSNVILNFGDFSRYIKNDKELKKGNLSLIFNLILFSFFTVFLVLGADVFLNQKFQDLDKILTNPKDIIAKFDNLQITLIGIFFIIIAVSSSSLIANFIPSQYSLINFLPNKLNLKNSSYIIAIFSFLVALFWPTILQPNGIFSLFNTLSTLFGPIFGVMIADYYFIKKENLSNKDINSTQSDSAYHFTNGWHLKGIYSLFLGFIFSAATIWNINLVFMESYSWLIGMFISFFTYYLLAKK